LHPLTSPAAGVAARGCMRRAGAGLCPMVPLLNVLKLVTEVSAGMLVRRTPHLLTSPLSAAPASPLSESSLPQGLLRPTLGGRGNTRSAPRADAPSPAPESPTPPSWPWSVTLLVSTLTRILPPLSLSSWFSLSLSLPLSPIDSCTGSALSWHSLCGHLKVCPTSAQREAVDAGKQAQAPGEQLKTLNSVSSWACLEFEQTAQARLASTLTPWVRQWHAVKSCGNLYLSLAAVPRW